MGSTLRCMHRKGCQSAARILLPRRLYMCFVCSLMYSLFAVLPASPLLQQIGLPTRSKALRLIQQVRATPEGALIGRVRFIDNCP